MEKTSSSRNSSSDKKKSGSKVDHGGHRVRLTKLVSDAGIENVTDIQAVEFFLTYIIPRCDVNPLAHRLLDRYGNFGNIIDADVNDLKNVEGISNQSAMKIKLFKSLMEHYIISKSMKRISLQNKNEFLDFLESLMQNKPTENLYLLAIDHGFKLIGMRKYDLDKVRNVGLEPIEIYKFIISTHPAYLACAHNHPGGSAIATENDQNASKYIIEIIKNLECQFLDSLIVGTDGIYSVKNDGFLRNYDNVVDFHL